MPARTGVSSCSTVWPILRRPSARSVPRCLCVSPMTLRVWVIRTFAILRLLRHGLLRSLVGQHLRDREAAHLRHLVGAAEGLEAVDRRLRYVDRVRGAEALREDVADSGQLEHGAHAAARDHARPLARRPQQHARRVGAPENLVRDRRTVLRHREEVLLRVLDGLRDRKRHLAGLAVADADAIDFVADHDEGREREAPAALDDLRNAVDLDHALLELAAFLALDHLALDGCEFRTGAHLDLQASFARRIGQRLDASVVEVAASVEDRGRDIRLPRLVGEQLADLRGLRGLVPFGGLDLQPAGGHNRAAVGVVDELGDDASVRARDDEAGPVGRARDLAAYAAVAALTCFPNGQGGHYARFPTLRRTYSPW